MDVASLLNNNIGLVTILVGFVAFAVYSKQRWDAKRAIANTLLLEIKAAENALNKARDYIETNRTIPEDILLMPNESWSRYRQDFVRDFEHDEWELIGDFYSKCQLYDEAARNDKLAFSRNEEQIRANAHRIVADYAKQMVEESIEAQKRPIDKRVTVDEMMKTYNLKEEIFERIYLNDGGITKPLYSPKIYMTQARLYTSGIQSISHSNIGTKLKKLAKRGWLRNLFHLYS